MPVRTRDHHILFDAKSKLNLMLHQVIEPLLTNELTISCEVFNFVTAKDMKKLIDELNAFLGIRIAFLGKKHPKQGESGTLMHDRQDQKIDHKASQHPIGTVDR